MFIQPPKSNFIHCACSDSNSSWEKFDESFSFSNKAQCVPRKNSTKFVDCGFNAQIISIHVGYVECSGGIPSGCAVPNKTWSSVSTLPAMFSSSLLFTWYSTAVEFGVQAQCWVSLYMSLLWQAGQWMSCCLNCVSSTLWTFNRQFCLNFKLVQQTQNNVAQGSDHPDDFLQGSIKFVLWSSSEHTVILIWCRLTIISL